jgi:hypothetical protein
MRGLATRRARWDPRLPLAVGAVVVLGAALPAAIAVGGGTLLDGGVRSAVETAGPAGRGVAVTTRLDPADPAAQERIVRGILDRTFDGVPVTTWHGLRSEIVPLHGVQASPGGQLRLVAEVLPDAAGHARLVGGRWPDAPRSGAPVPAALGAAAADHLGVGVGDTLALGRPGTAAARTVEVVGLWAPADRDDPYWFGDPLELSGAERDTVRGPLLVAAGADGAPPDFGGSWTARWRTAVDAAGLTAGDAERLSARLGALPRELERVPTAGGGVARADGGLAATLAYPRAAMPLARSTTVAVLVLVAGLVALVAAQAAALLAGGRARESGVLRARGASRTQRLRLDGAELLAVAALAVVPAAAVAAATLASPLGPGGAGTGTTAAVLAAAGCLAVAAVVSLAVQVRPGRHGLGPADPPRATLDLALAATLGVALWQLWTVGRDLPRGGTGDVDPVLAIAPAVALGAAGVLVVRALGPLARGLGRLARRDGALPALLGWHASRRGTRPAAPLVAVVVVAAAAVVALSAQATADATIRDRTAAELGGDVVVTGSPGAPPADGNGGEPLSPVVALDGSIGQEDVRFLAADAADLPAVTSAAGRWALREDDVRPLADPDRERGGLALPDGGDSLSLTLASATTVSVPPASGFGMEDVPPEQRPVVPPRTVTALLTAPDGTQRAIRLPDLPPDGRPHTLTVPLPPGLDHETRLAAIETDVPTDEFLMLTTRFDVLRIATGQAAAATPRTWRVVTPGAGAPGTEQPAEAVPGAGGTIVRATFLTFGELDAARLLPDTPPVDTDVPVVLDRALAERVGTAPGETLDATVGGRSLTLRVERVVDRLPGGRPAGVPDDGMVPPRPGPGALLDLAALGEVTRDLGLVTPPDPAEWWLGGSPNGPELRAALPDAEVLTADDVVARRLADPFAAGLGRLLALAALAALAVALGALLLGNAVAASGRRNELAVLRALGLDTAQVRRLLVLEHAVVGGAALVAGLALGLAVAPVLVPGLVGVPVATGAPVQVAWLPVLGAALVLAAAVAAGGVTAGRRAARLRPAAVLREDAT